MRGRFFDCCLVASRNSDAGHFFLTAVRAYKATCQVAVLGDDLDDDVVENYDMDDITQ